MASRMPIIALALLGALLAQPAKALTNYDALARGFLTVEVLSGAVDFSSGAEVFDSGKTADGGGFSSFGSTLTPGAQGVTQIATASGGTVGGGGAASRMRTDGSVVMIAPGGDADIRITFEYLVRAAASTDDPTRESASAGARVELSAVPGASADPLVFVEAAAESAGTVFEEFFDTETFELTVPGGDTLSLFSVADAEGEARSTAPYTPAVPLPGALPLALTAVAALGALARRRRR